MLAFNSFDPYAMLVGQTPEDAKAAKLAKVSSVDPTPSLASLATLAAGEPQSHSVPVGPIAWSAIDWQAYFDERAAIAEYDGGLSRADAEAQAFECCISRWLADHPQTQPDATICPHCGKPNGAIGRVTIATANGIWLHGTCHAEWLKRRRQQAIIELPIQHIQAGDTPHGN